MLLARFSYRIGKQVATKAATRAMNKRRLTTIEVQPSLPSFSSVAPSTAYATPSSLVIKSFLNNQGQEIAYCDTTVSSIFNHEEHDSIVVDNEDILECIKRTYQPNWKRRKAKHGYLARNATPSGRKVNKRRALAGRRISI